MKLSFAEVLTIFIFLVILSIVLAYYAGTWIYNYQQKQKNKVSLRFQEKFAYLNALVNNPADEKHYKEIIQDYCDLKPKSEIEHAMKNDLCARFKFKYASYL
jgi:hypothetical protein